MTIDASNDRSPDKFLNGDKITIREVAKHAGVSISSVSRALSDHPHVSDELRARVQASALALGYQPDFLAHSLRSGRTQSVGFIVGTISNPIMADISASLGNVLAEHGYALMLLSSQNRPEMDVSYLQFLARRQASGLIISTATSGTGHIDDLLAQLEIPTVMLDRERLPGNHISSVQSDHRSAMQAAVLHLASQGHHRIALIGGKDIFPARARLAGFYDGFQQAGIEAEPSLVRSSGMSKAVGYNETLSLMAAANRPTALIAGGNLILAGVLQALQELKIAVGRDLALIGCDDTELTRLYSPAITVIARDLALIGETAARLLLETIQNEDEKQDGSGLSDTAGKTVILPTQLVIRESSLRSPIPV